MDLQPSGSSLSTAPSMENTGDNLEELEAEAMRLRVENERVEWKWRLKAKLGKAESSIFMADAFETATAGQGPPKRRPPSQPDVNKPKVTFSSPPSPTPLVMKACWSFLGQGTCKKGSK
jgi:hypothetical protein